MSNKIIEPNIAIPNIEVDKKLVESIKNQYDVERQVIVHCDLDCENLFSQVRIWRTTILRDMHSSHKSKLLDAYNISFHPIWTPVIGKVSFTLIFEALPKECTSFDLFEDIPTANGFFTGTINRKKSDVYRVRILY